MNWRPLKSLLTLACIALCISMFAQEQFNIEEAVQYAVENSAQTKINALELAKAEAQIKEYRATGLPQVNGTIDYQHFINLPTSLLPAEFFGGAPGTFAEVQFGLKNSVNAGASLNTLLFDGSFFTGLKAQRIYKDLIYKQANQSEYQIKKSVTQAYLGVVIAQRNKRILEKNIENLEKTLNETTIIYENGFAEKLDVSRLQLSFDNLNTELQRVERLINLSKNLLKFQMNYPLEMPIILTESLDDLADKVFLKPIDLDAPIDISNRPEYSVIQVGEQLNDLNIEALRRGYYPSLVGFASAQTALQRNNLFDEDEPGFFPTTIVGLSLSVPIWDSFSRSAKIQQAKVDQEITQVEKAEFERAVNLEVYNARLSYENAMNSVGSSKRAETLAREIYQTAQIKFQEGVGSSLELTQAEQNLYNAQANYATALYDLVVAKSDLDLALGQ
ncbi:TolC family protein [Portibacter marinus]|uniref:TolC family protein n=1 Tax=Portibacter marinus TaxID=2898660 RepID=UPI001F23577E|nr:TolC family protein [Portibacter marinus]